MAEQLTTTNVESDAQAMPAVTPRGRWTLAWVVVLWVAFYASFALVMPRLLDDADSVHSEVAREMLLRRDYVTLYANGIRYLEKAPLLYWGMAACLKVFALLGFTSATARTVAVRLPLAFTVLALALVCESLARRMFHSARAGLYAALILLSSFGIFIFTRITIPDAMVCLWISTAMWCSWRTEELDGTPRHPARERALRWCCWEFAASCALNVLTKGLIGVVFPVAAVAIYLWLTRGWERAWTRVKALSPWSSLLVFLAMAAPWHVLAGLANPTQGHPTHFRFVHWHWIVPLPTDGNVHGWFWFYFMNEHVLRYLNLRVPRDYDTVPLVIFWGLCLVWMMPWSAFGFKAIGWALPLRSEKWRSQFRRHDLPLRRRGLMLLVVWAAFVLLFFAFSTRQEYYVLPAIPAVAVLIAGWLQFADSYRPAPSKKNPAKRVFAATGMGHDAAVGLIATGEAAAHCTAVLLALGVVFAAVSVVVLLHAHTPAGHPDLARLLSEHPNDYAMSMGHFLDLNAEALGLFRLPLILAAVSLVFGPLISWVLRRRALPHAANYVMAAGAFGFLLAAHIGLQRFAPVISSAQLAEAIAPQVKPQDMVAIHGEYESGSTLGFYLKRPAAPGQEIHILEGRSSNLWYGSFFPDAPKIFETPESFRAKWNGPQRIFLWQSLTDPPNKLPAVDGPVYVIAKGGGKEIVSNQPSY
jgi:4-amino-4-deoxy-L-arabinose transferase-like glycosyltransferase